MLEPAGTALMDPAEVSAPGGAFAGRPDIERFKWDRDQRQPAIPLRLKPGLIMPCAVPGRVIPVVEQVHRIAD